ncbi:MAG: hypothetical protein ACI8W7_004482 [Gammaproteobacteria bacterium]|jgi:hypothetical protein
MPHQDIDNQLQTGHWLAEVARPDQHPGQVGRFGNVTRMVIHPTETDPTQRGNDSLPGRNRIPATPV